MSVPDLSPLYATTLVCHKCGREMKKKVVMRRSGQTGQVVDHIQYTCINEKTECRYMVKSTTMHTSEMIGLREDRSEVRP